MAITRKAFRITACKKDLAGNAKQVTLEATLSESVTAEFIARVEGVPAEKPASWTMEEGAGPQWSDDGVIVTVVNPDRKRLSDVVVPLNTMLLAAGVGIDDEDIDLRSEVTSLEEQIAAW